MEEKLMPDFDTRTPQRPNEPNRSRITLIANRLRGLLTASKLRILSMATTFRRLLMANRRRTLLIGGSTVLFMVAAALGLSIYSSSELASGVQKDNDLQHKVEDAKLTPLAGCPVGGERNQRKGMNFLPDVMSDKRIVFVRDDDITNLYFVGVGGTLDPDANIKLYMISADGTSLTRLTKTTVKEYGANRLPDGRKVNILWDTEGRTIQSISYFPNAQGTGGFCSPDGKREVFAALPSTSTVTPGNPSSDLYVRTENGTKQLKSSASANGDDTSETEPSFSPDSEKIAFNVDDDIYVANADGSDPTNLTDSLGDKYYVKYSSIWWPDSEKIAFIGEKGIGYGDAGYGDLYVINADGSGLTQLTDNAPVGENIAVSPDGKKIAFLGQPASNPRVKQRVIYDLYVINADGTGLTKLSDEVTRKYVTVEGHGLPLPSPSFSPDSKQIAFLRSTEGAPLPEAPYAKPDDIDMYVVNVDGTDLTRLTNTEPQEGILTWVWK